LFVVEIQSGLATQSLDLNLPLKMSQRTKYYEEELDDADDLADVGLNLTIGNYGQGGLYEDGSMRT